MKYRNRYAEFDTEGGITQLFPDTLELVRGLVWEDDLEGLQNLLYDLGAKDCPSECGVTMETPQSQGRVYKVFFYQNDVGLLMHNASDGDPDIMSAIHKLIQSLMKNNTLEGL